jgi:TolB-like protein/DNA-binding winged helix-turn-helix (wHTH) protein/Tfp pilus assembly protein PilF
MAVSVQSHSASFGEFTVDFRVKEIRRNGIRIKLAGQSFTALETLLERAGEVVTREELRARLWQGETFVDFDHSLNVAVNRIREVLCDSAESPRYIETIPRLGYRFIAKLNADLPTAGINTVSSSSTPAIGVGLSARPVSAEARSLPTLKWRRVPVSWYAGLVLLLLISLVVIELTHRRSPSSVAATTDKTMLAVLPFENLTGDPANEYFSDGLTEEMITQLATLEPSRLGVIARTSVMSYKHGDRSIAHVGDQLHVQYVLEGSLRQSSGRVRITAQLIQVKDQTHIWAQDYDRNLGDVLTLEREVSGNVAREIQLELTSQEQANLAQPRPVDPEAHELYLKGRFYWNQRTPNAFKKSVDYFEGAIRRDPNYAEAYVGLADAYRFLMNTSPPDEVLPKARAAAEKALAINPNLAEAHASLGLIAPYFDWDWETARKHLERALQLNPNSAITHDWYADGYLSIMGRMDESLAEMRVAQRLDPLSCVINGDMGKTLFFARRYDEAIAQLRSVLEMDPNCYVAVSWLRMVYEETGNYQQTLELFEKEKTFLYTVRDIGGIQAGIYAKMGHTEQARQSLGELLKRAQTEHVDPGLIAATYIELGDKDQAFAWLEKAYAEHSNWMSSLKVWPLYDTLRDDPRFADLERRVKLLP